MAVPRARGWVCSKAGRWVGAWVDELVAPKACVSAFAWAASTADLMVVQSADLKVGELAAPRVCESVDKKAAARVFELAGQSAEEKVGSMVFESSAAKAGLWAVSWAARWVVCRV